MKNISPKEAIEVLKDMKIEISLPKAAVTQRKRNAAIEMAIDALRYSELPNSSDLISRQVAIDDLHGKDPSQIWDTADIEVWVNGLQSAQPEPCEDAVSRKAVEYLLAYFVDSDKYSDAVGDLRKMPSVTPKPELCEDVISRQAAIDALDKRFDSIPMELTTEILMLRKDLRELPSAQPEIIRCKNCRHWTRTHGDDRWGVGDCDVFDKHLVMCEGYCAWAERRTDANTDA